MSNFIEQLKQRRVIRAAISYVVVAWLIVQVVSAVSPALGLTALFMRYTLIVLVAGFPIAMILSWFYSFSTHGVTRESELESDHIDTGGRNLDFIVIGVLAAGLVSALLYIGSTKVPTAPKASLGSVLAVLPLTNISSNAPDNGFVDGLHDDLLTTLSQLSPLSVISRTSVIGFRNTTLPIPEIGAKLGADKIIEGSIQLANSKIRISVKLIDVKTDSQVWARSYEKEFNATQLFSLQRDIALAVAEELKVALSLDEDNRLKALPTDSTEAYRLYLLGRQRTADRTSDSLLEAIDFLEQAIELDPQYAEAYTELALAHTLTYNYSNVPLDDMISKAMPLVQRAIELDDSLADAYVILAELRARRDDIQGAESAFQTALEHNPNSALARHWFGILLADNGRYREALEQHQAAQKLDPLSPIISVTVAQDLTYLGQTEAASEEYQRTLEIKPDFVPAYAHMAALQRLSLKRPDESVRWLRKAWEMDSGHTEYPSQLAESLLDLGQTDLAKQWGELAVELGPNQYWPNRSMILHAWCVGDRDALERYSAAMLKIYPTQFHSLMYKAETLIADGKPEKAKSMFLPRFAKLLEQPPQVNANTYAHAILLAYVLQANGNSEQAATLLQTSLDIMDDQPRTGFTGVELFDVAALSLLGQSDQAVERLLEAQSSNWSTGWWALRHQPLFAGIRNREEVALFEQQMSEQMNKLGATLTDEGRLPEQ
ncbi:MAG: tetratricopeptide repeat protein [Gammaproteobacteria bacterium]